MYQDGSEAYYDELEDLRREDNWRRRQERAVLRCKGDPSECSCRNCNPPDEDFEEPDEQ